MRASLEWLCYFVLDCVARVQGTYIAACVRSDLVPQGDEERFLELGCASDGSVDSEWSRAGPRVYRANSTNGTALDELLQRFDMARLRVTKTKQDIPIGQYLNNTQGFFLEGSQLFTGGTSNVKLLEALLELGPEARSDTTSALTLVDARRIASVGWPQTGSLLHNHKCSWLYQGKGSKKWLFLPPQFEGWSLQNEDPCLLVQKGPEFFADHGAMTCTQEAGDAILIPNHWWHVTCNDGPGLAIAWGAQGSVSDWSSLALAARDGKLAELSNQSAPESLPFGREHPILLAASHGHASFLRTYETYFGKKQIIQNAQSALSAAAANGHLSVSEHIIQSYADALLAGKQPEQAQLMSLNVAARLGYQEIVAMLLQQLPSAMESQEQRFHVDLADSDGNTALMLAARGGHAEIMTLLLKHGASWTVADHSGSTAWHIASTFGPVGTIEALKFASGADAKTQVNNADFFGSNCLHVAASAGHASILASLFGVGDIASSLLQLGGTTAAAAIVDAPGPEYVRATPLHLAVIGGHVAACDIILFEAGELKNQVLSALDGNGETAYSISTFFGDERADVANYLNVQMQMLQPHRKGDEL